MVLPPKKMCSFGFMTHVLTGEKSLLPDDRPRVKPPCWPELAVKCVWPTVKDDEEVRKFFPSCEKGELPSREYFWNVLARVKPEYYRQLLTHAIQQRGKNVANEECEKVEIRIKTEWLEKLKAASLLQGKLQHRENDGDVDREKKT